MGYGWKGKQVRHLDGRLGEITKEDPWFAGCDLHITVEGGGTAIVKLNATQKDGGELGWSWWCPEFSSGPCWLPLGDHNPQQAPAPVEQTFHDYANEPIGGSNPYYRCVHCKKSDPAINGRLEGHLPDCAYRKAKEQGRPYNPAEADDE